MKYRRNRYMKELQPTDIWPIFNYDVEWVKFNKRKREVETLLKEVVNEHEEYRYLLETLAECQEPEDLESYHEISMFYAKYHQVKEFNEVKLPQRYDDIADFRKCKIMEFARKVCTSPKDFILNLK